MVKDVMMKNIEEIVPDMNSKEGQGSTTALPSSGGTTNQEGESYTFNRRGV